jgi:hypothetical protein
MSLPISVFATTHSREEPETLAAVLHEELGVDDAVARHVEGHVPVAGHLTERGVVRVIGLGDLHQIVERLREPAVDLLSGCAKDWFASQLVQLENQIGIVVIGKVFRHESGPPFGVQERRINNKERVELLTTNCWLVLGEPIGKPNTNQQLVVNAPVTVLSSDDAGHGGLR